MSGGRAWGAGLSSARGTMALLGLAAVAGGGGGACFTDPLPINGACARDDSADVGCNPPPDGGGAASTAGLLAYTCSGAARPDQDARYVEGVPQGLVCADSGASPDGRSRYCCTPGPRPCAFNPVAICDTAMFGYECLGADRPESLNPALTCGQGVRKGDYADYCCAGTPQPDGCLQSDAVTCSPQMIGWTCMGAAVPKAEWLGANKSRADTYYLLCATPTPAPNPAYENYCCISPALVPEGGSCVQDTAVPGCAPGRFGFACTGRDAPGDDYLPMHCPDRGVAGKSQQGYPATLYCCDFE